jgi:Holliday junction resolvase
MAERLRPEPWEPEEGDPDRDGKVDFDREDVTQFTVWIEYQQGEPVVHIKCYGNEAPFVDFEGGSL